jgi:hypothetical protein
LDTPNSILLLWRSDQPEADLFLTRHNTHKGQTFMPSAGFEPTISASEWSQTYALDFVATGIGHKMYIIVSKM